MTPVQNVFKLCFSHVVSKSSLLGELRQPGLRPVVTRVRCAWIWHSSACRRSSSLIRGRPAVTAGRSGEGGEERGGGSAGDDSVSSALSRPRVPGVPSSATLPDIPEPLLPLPTRSLRLPRPTLSGSLLRLTHAPRLFPNTFYSVVLSIADSLTAAV